MFFSGNKEDRKEKKSFRYRLIRNIIIIVVVFLGADCFSHFVFHRSGIATIASIGIRIFNSGVYETEETADAAMEKRSEEEDEPFILDTEKYKNNVQVEYCGENQIITFGEKNDADDIVIYLHGGAYINEISSVHLDFLDRMASATKAYIVAPLYPLAPNHTYEETYEFLDEIYPDLRSEDKEITIMGDSAGGGLAIAYCEYLIQKKWEQPDEIIAFSPWVDVSMSAVDHTPYEDADPMLEVPGTVEIGKEWTGSDDTKNYMVSPLFGDVSGIAKTMIFVGTDEILYPDCTAMYEKMKEAGVDAELIIGEGMTHIYPIYPLVPESLDAAERVFEEINK